MASHRRDCGELSVIDVIAGSSRGCCDHREEEHGHGGGLSLRVVVGVRSLKQREEHAKICGHSPSTREANSLVLNSISSHDGRTSRARLSALPEASSRRDRARPSTSLSTVCPPRAVTACSGTANSHHQPTPQRRGSSSVQVSASLAAVASRPQRSCSWHSTLFGLPAMTSPHRREEPEDLGDGWWNERDSNSNSSTNTIVALCPQVSPKQLRVCSICMPSS